MPTPLTGRRLLRDDAWQFDLYAVGPSAISTTPTLTYTNTSPGPIQGEVTVELGGLGAVRGGAIRTTEAVDWAPSVAGGVRYACRFQVRDADTGQWVALLSGYIRDVVGGLGSGGLYTIMVGGLGDLNADGAVALGYTTLAGWISSMNSYGAGAGLSGMSSWRQSLDASVATLAGGDHGVRADCTTVVGQPAASADVTPLVLAATDLHGLQYNGPEVPPYVSEVIAQTDARLPIASQARSRPSVLTPRRMGSAKTTDTEQPGTRLATSGVYNTQVTSAVGSYQRNWGLSAWVNGSIRNQASDYDVVSLSMSRSITTKDTSPTDNRVRVNYGIAVASQASSSAVGWGVTGTFPRVNIPGLVEKADQTIELGPNQSHVMKVELSKDCLQPRGSPLYVYAYCVVGYVTSASNQPDFGMVTLGADWVAAPVERVPTGALLDLPREYSYPYGSPGTWQAETPGILIPPAVAAVPDASQPVAAARITYAPGRLRTAIQTGVTKWG